MKTNVRAWTAVAMLALITINPLKQFRGFLFISILQHYTFQHYIKEKKTVLIYVKAKGLVTP